MATRTVEQQVIRKADAELPKLKRTPCFKCVDGYVVTGNAGKNLCPACYGATYVIAEEGQG